MSDLACHAKQMTTLFQSEVTARGGRRARVFYADSPPPPWKFQYPSVFLCLLLSFKICTTALNVQVSYCDDQGRLV